MKKLGLTLLMAVLIALPAYAGGRQMDYTMENGVTVTDAYAEITDLYYNAGGTSYYIYSFYKDLQAFTDGKEPLGRKRYNVPYSDVQSSFSTLVDAIRPALYAHSDSIAEIDSDGDGIKDKSFFGADVVVEQPVDETVYVDETIY